MFYCFHPVVVFVCIYFIIGDLIDMDTFRKKPYNWFARIRHLVHSIWQYFSSINPGFVICSMLLHTLFWKVDTLARTRTWGSRTCTLRLPCFFLIQRIHVCRVLANTSRRPKIFLQHRRHRILKDRTNDNLTLGICYLLEGFRNRLMTPNCLLSLAHHSPLFQYNYFEK